MNCEVLVQSEMPQHPKSRTAMKTNTQRKCEGVEDFLGNLTNYKELDSSEYFHRPLNHQFTP